MESSNSPTSELEYHRSNNAIQLRRTARTQDISQRRSQNINIDKKQVAVGDTNIHDLNSKVQSFLNRSSASCDIDKYIEKFKCEDVVLIHEGIIAIRKYVSINQREEQLRENIQKIIDANVVIRIVEFMKLTQFPRLVMECAWVITNLVAGTTHQCQSVVKKGAIPALLNLLVSDDDDMISQIVWGIGNISSDSIICRDALLKNGAIQKLIHILNTQERYQTVRQVVWCLSVICRRPHPPPQYLVEMAPPIFSFIANGRAEDEAIVKNLCQAIIILTDKNYRQHDILSQVLKSGTLSKLVDDFNKAALDKPLLISVLNIFGNIASQDEGVNQLLKFEGILRLIEQKLGHEQRRVRQQALRVFQNLASNAPNQMLESPTLLRRIVSSLGQEQDIQQVAISTLNNLVLSKHRQLPQLYYTLGVYGRIPQFLKSSSIRVLLAALEFVYELLVMDQEREDVDKNMIKRQLEKVGLVNELQELQMYKADRVYNANLKILDRFYESEPS